jgi:phage I-like protein
MPSRSASPLFATLDAAPDVAFGVVTIDAAALSADGDAGARWIQVTPRGAVDCRDGRHFIFEPERLVARFEADGIDVPIDIDHAIPTKAKLGEKADAVGWIKKLEARANGTYALVEMLAAGAAALKARTHRFVSPTFPYTKEGLALWLHSAALVAAPALPMAAIASASLAPKEQSMLKAIAKALGLAETADEAACLAAIGKLSSADPLQPIAKALGLAGAVDQAACLSAIGTLSTGKVDKVVHDQALANLTAATTQVTTLQAQLATRDTADHSAKVTATIDAALAAKKIVPAQRDQFTKLCATAEGLAQVEALLAATPAGLQGSDLDTRNAPAGDAATSSDALLAKAHALIDTASKSGRTLSLADAVVQANNGSI